MPKEIISIENFQGMLPNADPLSLPKEVASVMENVDLFDSRGSLAPVHGETTVNDDVADPVNGRAFTIYKDGAQAAYYDLTDTRIKILKSLGGTVTVTDPAVASAAEDTGQVTGVSDGQSVHFGLGGGGSNAPKWIGDIDHNQIWDGTAWVVTAAGADQVEDAVLQKKSDPSGTPTSYVFATVASSTDASSPDATVFSPDMRIDLFYSVVYDHLQESPLQALGPIGPTSAHGWSSFDLELTVETDDLSPRVTGFILYWASRPVGGERGPIQHFYHIDITDDSFSWTQGTPTSRYERDVDLTVDEYPTLGASYEDRTGVPATLDHMNVHYGISCAYEGYHFIARPWVQDAGDLSTQVLRSKPYQFDTFDWSNDFVTLPVKPTAIVGFEGRLYAFCEGTTYILSTDLALIDEIPGKGAMHRESVVATDRGMFFADSRSAYFLETGDIADNVGLDVQAGEGPSIVTYNPASHGFTDPVICLYHAEKDLFLLVYELPLTNISILFYHAPSRTWGYKTISKVGSEIPTGGFIGIDGEVYLCRGSANALDTIFTGSNESWQWYSKQFHFDGEPFIVYKIKVVAGTAPVDNWCEYFEDSPDYGTGTDLLAADWTNLGGDTYEAVVNSSGTSPWTQVRNFAFIFKKQMSGQVVQNVELVVRRLPIT